MVCACEDNLVFMCPHKVVEHLSENSAYTHSPAPLPHNEIIKLLKHLQERCQYFEGLFSNQAALLVKDLKEKGEIYQKRKAKEIEELNVEIESLKRSLMEKEKEVSNNSLEIKRLREIEVQVKEWEAKVFGLERDNSQQKSEIEQLSSEISDLKQKALEKEFFKSKAEELETLNANLRKSTEEQEKKVKERDVQISSLNAELEEKGLKIKDLGFQIDELKEDKIQYEFLQKKFKELEEENTSNKKLMDDYYRKYKEGSYKITSLNSELSEKDKEIQSLRSQLEELKLEKVMKEDLEKRLKTSTEENSKLREEANEYNRRLKEKELENSKLRSQGEQKEKQIQSLNSKLREIDILKQEKEELSRNLEQLRTEKEGLKKQLEEHFEDLKQTEQKIAFLNSQLNEKSALADDLESKLRNYEKENSQQLNEERDQNQKNRSKIAQLEKELEALRKEISAKDQEFKDLKSRLSESEEDKARLEQRVAELFQENTEKLAEMEKRNKASGEAILKEKHLRILCANYRKQNVLTVSCLMNEWKLYYKLLKDEGCKEDVHETEEAEESAAITLETEKNQLLRENVLMREYQKLEKVSKPMSTTNLFKFLEEMMDNKYKTDQKDYEDKRQPRTITDFTMEYLNRKFGILSLALKFLAQFMPTLKGLVGQGHKYAEFYARLLQVFHKDPVPYNLGLYLVKARIRFLELIEKANRLKERFGIKSNTTAGVTHGKAANEYAGTGGEAMLDDVLDMVYVDFTTDSESGTLMLKLLKPSTVSFNNHIAFLISHKMKRAGKRPEEIFRLLDKDSGGSIDADEFIKGTKSDLDLWLNDEDIKKFFVNVDTSGNGELELDEFLACINFEKYDKCAKSSEYVVTKSNYLNSLIEVYDFRQLRDAVKLEKMMSQRNLSELNVMEFDNFITTLDSGIPPARIQEFFTEALLLSEKRESNIVTKSAFIRFCVRNGIGGYGLGSFVIRELFDRLGERNFAAEFSRSASQLKMEETKSSKRRSVKLPKGESPMVLQTETIKEETTERKRSSTLKH